jgi:hypothetical protein
MDQTKAIKSHNMLITEMVLIKLEVIKLFVAAQLMCS